MLKLGQNYDLLCNMIIRPPRFVYEMSDLGPRYFSAGGKPAQRTDFELRNERGMIIQCSHFEPLTNWEKPMPCVIYLHGNGGCRIEALDVVHTLLPAEISVLALDFAGSGLSEGEYVSLGYWEQYDVATVVQYLREAGRCSTIGLWGRSMGAVTAILYSMQDPSIASMILDSPFCSLQKIAEDLVLNIESLQKVPRFTKFAVGLAMKPIRNTIKKKAKFDIKALEILELVPKCFIPALFLHGRDDNFVLPMHSELLHASYSGDKNRIVVEGNHNSMRPNFFMDSAVIFFNNTLHNGAAHDTPHASTLPELPLSMPQRQAEIQLQQFNDILHPHNHTHASVTTQATPAAIAHAHAQTPDQPQGLVMEEIDVSGETAAFHNHVAENHTNEKHVNEKPSHTQPNGLKGSVIIDDMVIGNTVIIDGKEVVLDADDDFYVPSQASLPALSSTPPTTTSHPSIPSGTFVQPPTAHHTTTTTTTQDSIPKNDTETDDSDSENENENENDNLPNTTTTDLDLTQSPPLEPTTSNTLPIHHLPAPTPANPTTAPHSSEDFIVQDNVNSDDDEEEIPEEIEGEDNNNPAPTLSFRAEADIPEDLN